MQNSVLKSALANLGKNAKSEKKFELITPEILSSTEEGKIFGGCNTCKSRQTVNNGGHVDG